MRRWWLVKRSRARRIFRQLRKALRKQVHDDKAVLAAWDSSTPAKRRRGKRRLEEMLARSTGSINNSYTKVQIATGLTIGLIALFLTVFGQLATINTVLLTAAVLANAVSIGISLLVTTPRTSAWLQTVHAPGVIALEQSDRQEYLALSRRCFHNRVVLLGNRRLSWLATWCLTLPGLACAMLAWSPRGTLLLLAIVVALGRLYRRVTGGRPLASLRYPYS